MFRIFRQPQSAAAPFTKNPPANLPSSSSVPAENNLHANDIQPADPHAAAPNSAAQAKLANSVDTPPLPRASDLLDTSLRKLSAAVHALPQADCKEAVLTAMSQCSKKVADAQNAAALIEASDLLQAHSIAVKPQELLRLRSNIRDCSRSVGEALQELDQLATNVQQYPDNETPSTKAMVLAGIASVAGALAMLVVMVAAPPLGLVLLGALAIGGAAGGGYLIHKICQAAFAHGQFEKADRELSGRLRESLQLARTLERRFNSELLPVLNDNAKAQAMLQAQQFLDRQMALPLSESRGDVSVAREKWRGSVERLLEEDIPRDQSESVFPYEIAGERLLPHGFHAGLDGMTLEDRQVETAKRTTEAKKAVIAKIGNAAKDDDSFDALLYLMTQRPRNAVENAAKVALAGAIALPSDQMAVTTAAGARINLVQIACDESGKAVGGTITYKLYQTEPGRQRGASPLHIMPLGLGDEIQAPEDASLEAVATFDLEGRSIKVTSLDFRASPSFLAACAEVHADDIDLAARSGRQELFVFREN